MELAGERERGLVQERRRGHSERSRKKSRKTRWIRVVALTCDLSSSSLQTSKRVGATGPAGSPRVVEVDGRGRRTGQIGCCRAGGAGEVRSRWNRGYARGGACLAVPAQRSLSGT
jgi:hypothetical protein